MSDHVSGAEEPRPVSSSAQAADVTPPPTSVWAAVVESVRGAHRHDYTTGPIGRSLLLLAVPMVLEVALESVFAVVNIFWVGRLGAGSVAAIGLTEAMVGSIYALAMGLGIGASALVARRIGEKSPEGAACAAVQAILLGILVAIPIAILGATFAPDLLRIMGGEPEVVHVGTGYARILFGGNVVILLLFLVNAIFRGAGDAAISMRSLWIANITNLALDPLLIFGFGSFPGLGLEGAAVATTVGRGMGVLYQFRRLAGRGKRFEIRRAHLRFDPGVLRSILRLSGTAIVQILINTLSWALLVKVVSIFGKSAVAGYTIGIRIVIFAILPAWGLSNAAATMVGQALGARDPSRAERSVWKAGVYNVFFLGGLGVLFVVFAPNLLDLFDPEPEVRGIGIHCLRIVSAGFPFYAYGMVLTSAFNGAGDTWTPTALNLVCFWILEIPLAWCLAAPLGLGSDGAFIAVAVAFSTLALTSALLFRRGRWKSKVV